MKVVILGGRSRLASYLHDAHAALEDEVWVLSADVTSPYHLLGRDLKADVVINCAAVTDLNYAERNIHQAFRVNSYGAANAALFARTLDAMYVQISTDYVFRGDAGPYSVGDRPYPIQNLGYTKFAGELAVRNLMRGHPHMIIRLGWLYGARYLGSPPMQAIEKNRYVRDDERGTPTHAGEAARMIAYMLHTNVTPPLVHLAPEMEPVSWYEFIHSEVPIVEPLNEGKPLARPRRPLMAGLRPNVWLARDMTRSLGPLWRELESQSRPPKRLGKV